LMKGLAPIPGWLGDYDWQGFYPNGQASAFPRLIDPAEGWLASANQKPMGLSDSTFTGAEFTRPYRFDRIVDLIKASPRHDLKTFAAMQGDQRSLIMAKLVQALLRNLAGADPTSLTPELLKLQAWAEEGLAPSPAFPQGAGAAMSAKLEEPLLATLWVDAFRRELLMDEIGDALFAAFEAQRLKTDIVLQALTLPAYAHWCDKIGTQARENCSDLVSSSLKLARAEMARRVKTLGGTSSWGAHHAMLFEHRPLGKHAQLGSWFNVHEPVGGDATTVFATRHEPWHAKDPVASQFGPGFRSRYDLADLEQSEYVIAPGQVGHVLSPYYEHLTKAWVEVRGVQIATEPAKFQRDSIGLTTLYRTPLYRTPQ
jgi:penicillin G amidase